MQLKRDFRVRDLNFETNDAGEETLLVRFSSETPVIRTLWNGYECVDYDEILVHGESNVNLERINNGVASLLFNHDYDRHLGIIVPGSAFIDSNEKAGYARVRFSKVGELAQEIRAKVEEGTINAVSVNYTIEEYHLDDVERKLYVDNWSVTEISFVSAPADMTAKVVRSVDGKLTLEDLENVALNTSVKDSPNKARNMATDIKKNKRAEETETEVTETETEVTETETETGNADQPENTDGNGDQPNPEEQPARADDAPAPTAEEIAEQVIAILDDRDASRSQKANKERKTMTKETINTPAVQYDLNKVLRALGEGEKITEGPEFEYHQKMQKVRSGKSQRGSFFIPSAVFARAATGGQTTVNLADITETAVLRDHFVEALLAKSIIGTLGISTLPGLVEPVSLPRMTGESSFGFVPEDGSPDESSMSFDNVLIKPYQFSGAVPVTNSAKRSVPGLDTLISTEIVKRGKIALEKAMFSDTANTDGPAGILSQLTPVTSDMSYKSLITAIAKLTDAGVDEASIKFLMRGEDAATLRTTLRDDGVSGYIIDDNGTIGGRPVITSGVIPTGNVLLGDFSAITLADFSAFELLVDTTTYLSSRNTVYRVWSDISWVVNQPAALTLLQPAAA